jgi:hypothetical protein
VISKETTNHVNPKDNYIMPRGSATEAVTRNIVNLNPSLILHHLSCWSTSCLQEKQHSVLTNSISSLRLLTHQLVGRPRYTCHCHHCAHSILKPQFDIFGISTSIQVIHFGHIGHSNFYIYNQT